MEPIQAQPTEPKDTSLALRRNFIGMHSGLAMQFIIGLALATIVGYDPAVAQQPAAHVIILGLHTVIGFMLLIGSTIILVRTTKRPGRRWTFIGWAGWASIIAAVASGVLTIVSPWHEFFAFIMGLGFIAALMVYAYGLYYVREH